MTKYFFSIQILQKQTSKDFKDRAKGIFHNEDRYDSDLLKWICVLLDFVAFIPIRLNLSNRGEFSWSWILVPCTPTSEGERKLNYNLNWIWNWIIVYYLSVYVLQKNVA